MSDVLYLAWRYLAYHKFKAAVMVASIALIVYLPLGLNILMEQSARQLRARARQTPLLVGAQGSPLELVLRSLYFESAVPPSMPYAQLDRVEASGLAAAVPLYARFRTQHGPIIGTGLRYFTFRGLRVAAGRQMAMLGECVLGSEVARRADLGPGDSILSSAETMFDIAGVYPLKMKVAGILAPTGSPDDHAVFVDLKTAWIIEGLGHGHQGLDRPEAAEGVLRREGNRVIANASVVQYNQITPENVDSFHFHGDASQFPITSIIALPHDEKSSAVLESRYLAEDEAVQIVRPDEIMEKLLGTVFTVGRYVIAAVILVGLSTLATMVLVFVLSLQLRRRELETMAKIGGTRRRIAAIVAAEVCGVLALGITIAVGLAAMTAWFAASASRLLVQIS